MAALLHKHPTASVSAAATATLVAAYSPQLLMDAGQFARLPLALRLGWLALLVVAPPFVAFVAARRHRRTSAWTWLGVGLPVPVAAALLVWLDVSLEVRSGYLLAGSGEEAMAYGIGTALGIAGGIVLAVLVTTAAWMGATGSRSSGR